MLPPILSEAYGNFSALYEAGWPEDALKLIKNRTLVIAGLEAAMDTLSPQEAVEWLEQKVYPAMRDFQDNVADGGGEAALILWFADAKRIWHHAADNTNHWHCSGEHRNNQFRLAAVSGMGPNRASEKS